MTKASDTLQPLIDNLHGNGRLRVWSLVVTVLGDVVAPRGGEILMSDLLAIMAHLSISESALRTALSRLSKDGWVQSQRQGRISRYSFGPQGIAQFEPAEALIYAAPGSDIATDWAVLIPQSGTASFVAGLSDISAASARADQNLVLGAETGFFPDWIKSAVAPADVISSFNHFVKTYTALAEAPADLTPIDALCARVLLIHDWRRLALRSPVLPPALQPQDWNRPKAQALTAKAYRALLAGSEKHWPDTVSDQGEKMLARRFKTDHK